MAQARSLARRTISTATASLICFVRKRKACRSDESGPAGRLVLTGYGNFRDEHRQMHDLLDELRIPHLYRDGPERKHDWHSGWVSESVELLSCRSSFQSHTINSSVATVPGPVMRYTRRHLLERGSFSNAAGDAW